MAHEYYPPEVLKLFKREREIAEIVYNQAPATAKSVQTFLSSPLTNAATRSMLNRLVGKGVLARRRRTDSNEYEYVPAITQSAARERALRQLATDHFGGSLQQLADRLAQRQQRTIQ